MPQIEATSDCKLHLISRLHHTSWYFHKTRKTTEQLQSAKCNPLRGKRCEISTFEISGLLLQVQPLRQDTFLVFCPWYVHLTFGSMKVSYGSHTHHQEKNKAQLAAFVVHLKNPKKPPGKNQGSSIKMTQIYYNIIEKPENLPVCLTPSPCHCLMLNETQGVIRLDLEGYQDSRSLSPLKVGI